MKKVTIVGQYFYPEFSGTAEILGDLAAGLQDMGLEVEVLTGQPTYHPGQRLPKGEVLFGGVRVERLPLPYLARKNLGARVAGGVLFCALATGALAGRENPGCLLLVTNPPFLPWIGWILHKLRRTPYVCLVQDMYPEMPIALGYLKAASPVARLWRWTNAQVYRQAEAVIVLGARMAERMRETYGADIVTPIVIHNWADGDVVKPIDKKDNWFSRQYGLVEKLTIVYAGNMGLFHDIETLLEAARLLEDEEDISFVFIGGGQKRELVREWQRRWGLRNTVLLDYQPREILPFSLTCGDAMAVTLARGVEDLCVPGKLYTALAAGRAVLAVMGEGSEVGDIVERWRCGVRVAPGDAEGVAAAIQHWKRNPEVLAEMQANARSCFDACFTRGRAMREYYDVLARIRQSG